MLFSESAFFDARFRVLSEQATLIHGAGGIGTQSEKTLHSILKYAIEPREQYHEVKHLGSCCDIYNERGIFEIQTRSLYRLRTKLDKFLPTSPVHIVYPIPKTKILHWVNPETGEISEGRRTPKKGNTYDAVPELSSLRTYLRHENLTVHLLFLNVEEYRFQNGYGKDKKRHSTRMERIPLSCDSIFSLDSDEAYMKAFMPEELIGIPFFQKEYEKATHTKKRWAYCALQMLIDRGLLSHIETKGRAFVYQTT